jgi:hypothetical protein
VLGNSTATFKQVAGPGALAVTRSSGMGNCSRFVETAGRDFHGVADAFGVGDRDEAGARGGHGTVVPLWRRQAQTIATRPCPDKC